MTTNSSNGDYRDFLARKIQCSANAGFEPLWIPDFLFDFQVHLVDWAIRKGRAAIWADCGLGKTPMALVWADNVIRKTGKSVIIFTPLAVAAQFVREGEKFGIEVTHSRDGKHNGGIVVTNYERLHYFDPAEFIGAVGDESQAIKAFDGKRRKQVVRFFSKLPYRLLTTATPAPNDYIELGTASECLGIMTQSDMLGYFFRETKDMRHTVFKEGDFWNQCKYTFKPHSEVPFWKWIVGWARGCQKPSDLGFDDAKFLLPPLNYRTHLVDVPWIPPGELFPRPAISLVEQRDERKRTIPERCEKVRELVAHDRPAIVWCHYNEEGDYLEKILPRAIQIKGAHSLEYKEAVLEWFAGLRCLCTDPMFRVKLTAWQNEIKNTGNGVTENIGSVPLNANENADRRTQSGGNGKMPTHGHTMPATKENGNGLGKCKNAEWTTESNDTPATLNTAPRKSRKSRRGDSDIQTSNFASNSENTDSPSKNISYLLPLDVLSAERKTGETLEGTACTLTMTTQQESFAACSVQSAIKASDFSTMTQDFSNGPRCICGHADGNRKLVSKPKICALGLNLEFCGDMTFFPTFSFEQVYQGIRRCWRFGRNGPVNVEVVSAPGESRVMAGLERKQAKAQVMFASVVRHMNEAVTLDSIDRHKLPVQHPTWIQVQHEECANASN